MKTKPKSVEIQGELILIARKVAKNAHAPFSNFRVGAAVQTKTGNIYRGVNVENSSYGLTICAERVALASALTAGDPEITHIALSCIDAKGAKSLNVNAPCGACRQWIQEVAPNAEIHIDGFKKNFRIGDFLPNAFVFKKGIPKKS